MQSYSNRIAYASRGRRDRQFYMHIRAWYLRQGWSIICWLRPTEVLSELFEMDRGWFRAMVASANFDTSRVDS
jgi:hypothetical protein